MADERGAGDRRLRSGGAKHAQFAASYSSAVAVDGGLDRVRLSLVQVLRKVCLPPSYHTKDYYCSLVSHSAA